MPSFKHLIQAVQRFTCILLVYQLSLPGALAQTAGFLKLTTTDGEGAFNDIRHKLSHPPAVRVVDESNNLVAGAEVKFVLPLIGPGGGFADGHGTAIATTDTQGIARCPAFKPSLEEGRFNIKVTASYQGKAGTTTISQSNTLAGGSSVRDKKGHGMVLLLTLAAGGVVGGILVANRHTSPPPAAPTPTSLSVVSITVGGPR
jgi:hypothetical protein